MLITETQLRKIIREILLERKTPAKRKDGRKVLGEPDASEEEERDNPKIDQGEDVEELEEVDPPPPDDGGSSSPPGMFGCGHDRLTQEVNIVGGGAMGGGPLTPVGTDSKGSRSTDEGPRRRRKKAKKNKRK